MFSFFKSSIFGRSTEPLYRDVSRNLVDSSTVIEETPVSEAAEDCDFLEIVKRPMTYSEVAQNAQKPRTRLHVNLVRAAHTTCNSQPCRGQGEGKSKLDANHNNAADADFLYGDIAEAMYKPSSKCRKPKGRRCILDR